MVGVSILLAGLASGLLRWDPAPGNPILLLARVLLIPALWEEFVFRGLLSPTRGETRRPALAIAAGLAIFVGWHAVIGLVIAPAATMFLEPRFLLCAGLLGLACALMRYRTGSLWPPVAFHAVAVWAWQGFLGGPSMAEPTG